MSVNVIDIIYFVVTAVLLVIVGTNGIFNLIKWIKGKKYDENEFKIRCNLLADLIEKGVEVPKELIVAVLRGKISNNSFATRIASLSQEKPLKKGK